MVTEGIKTQGYLFLSSKAESQNQGSTKTDFSDSIQKAESKYQDFEEKGSETDTKIQKAFSDEKPDAKTEQATAADDEKTAVDGPEKESEADKTEKTEVMEVVAEIFQLSNQNEMCDVTGQQSEAAQELLGEISEQLQVSVEELQTVMQKLDLKLTDLQNPQKLVQLITDLKGPEELLTNPELAAVFKKLSGEIKEFFAEQEQNGDAAVSGQKQQSIQISQQTETTQNAQSMSEEQNQEHSSQDHETQMNSHVQAAEGNAAEGSTAAVQVKTAQGMYDRIQALVAERVDAETSESITKQVIDQVKLTMKNDVTSLEMQLYPEHLGKVSIQLVSKNGVMTAQIAAENEAAKMALESQLSVLKENFDSQGLKVQSVEVMVSARGFDQNTESGNNAQDGRGNGRKPKKGFLSGLDETEEKNLEEDLKEALGNTVSYTA